ncbi:MAG: hypothetical protein SGARI_006611, partial [Bacillariaceae sp.]
MVANDATPETAVAAANSNGNVSFQDAADVEAGKQQASVKQRNNRLSSISKKYDLGGKGVLNETEQAMRDMDSRELGYLSNEKVYQILQQQIQTQNQLKGRLDYTLYSCSQTHPSPAPNPSFCRLNARRLIIFFGTFAFVLALATLGTAFAAASLAKDTSVTNSDSPTHLLVIKGSENKVIATNTHGDTFGVNTLITEALDDLADGGGRSLQDLNATTNTTDHTESLIQRSLATTIQEMCSNSQIVNLQRTWDGYPELAATIALCPFQSVSQPSTGVLSYHLNNGRY